MRLLIIFSTLAVAVLGGYHHGADVHFAPAPPPYHGPLAPLAHDGRVVDTPEVAHAKAAHFHAYHDELSKNSHGYGHHEDLGHHGHHEVAYHHAPAVAYHHADHGHHGYHGPPAPLAHDGRVVDTPEVAHAKAAHFHAYAEELSKTAHHGPSLDYGHHY